MQTVTSKTAINGAKLWYVDGKRTSRDKAMFIQRVNDREASRLAKIDAEVTEAKEVSETVNEKFTTVKAENDAHAVEIHDEPNFDKIVEADKAYENAATVNEPDAQTETAKFEVGKTYAAKKSVLFDSQINMTVIKRTKCYVTIQIDDDEDDIRRCKVVDEYGVEKIHLHESNAIGGDYEFSAKDEVTEPDADGHIDGFDEDGDGDELINPPETTAEVNDLPEVKPEFKRYGSLKRKGANVMDSIFNHEHMTFNTHAEALAFIEKVANDTFEYIAENPHYLIRDENGEWTYATVRTFSNVNSMSPDYGTYEFTEIITADGKLDHVIFQRGFGIGAKTVKLYIEAPTDDLDEALHRVWKRLGHKHRWHIGRDSRDDPYPYYLDEDGEEVEADVGDDDECREVEEQLGLIYADRRDHTGLWESGWYAEDDPRLKDGYNESYGWREVESDYYRDVL